MGRRDKKGANQHNSKHENGVVAPYKKPAKQKSNGNLNGSADGRPKESTPSVQNNSSQNLTVPGETASAAIANASKSRSISSSRQQAAKNLAVSVSDDVEELDGGEAPKSAESQHRKIDVSSARSTTVPEGGSFNLALTVLRSCPIGDTLAILILLLSLPPTLVNFTNLMFAILTFVPPAGSFTTLPSLTDFTSSFSPAAPSVIVLLLIDFLAISIWYLLPLPLIQGILLDCAQATVATTLGGGYSNRPGASDKIVLMVMVVFATHLGRYRKTTLRWLRRTHLIKWLPDLDSFDDVPPRPSYKLGINRSWLDTLQIWLAIHILCQGLTRMVRRSLYTSRSSSFFSSHSRNIDPEAVSNTMAVMEASDGSHNPPNSPSIIKSKSSLQNLREVRDKISSGKRRRKQGNYVRSQQPLWAAFAATKATIMREYEQSQATRDARGSNAEGTKNLGCAPFADEEDRVWITSIDQDKFYFATGPLVPMQPRSTSKKKSDKLEDEAGIDRTKPVYVRINGANWASVKIEELEETEDLDGIIQWVGEVYGLSPASTYRVSFARCGDGVELHSEVIVTPSPPISEQVSPSNPTLPPTLRPASPASPVATLKTSIAAFESSVNDTLAQQKRMRKDTRVNTTALRRELEVLTEKLARLANNDKGLSGRQSQLSTNIQQAEDATSTLSEEIGGFAGIPEEALAEWQEHKATWEQTRNEQSRVQEDLQRTREDNRRTYTSIQTEALTARQKKETLQARTTKLTDRYKRLTSAESAQDNRQAQSEQSQRGKERDRVEGHYREQINVLQRGYHDSMNRWAAINAQRTALVRAADQNERMRQAQQVRLQYGSRPITPEGDIPGTKPIPSHDTYPQGRYTAFHTPESQPVFPASGFGSAGTNGLGRKMSNRRRSQSGVSGNSLHLETYEDDEDDPIPVQHKRKSGIESVREGSDGRSSGSGSPHVPYVPQLGHRGKGSPAGGSSG